MGKIRVFHVDDHRGFSDKLRGVLEPHVEWVGAASGPQDVLGEVVARAPDVVLVDVSMPGKGGFELAHQIRMSVPGTSVLIVSLHAEPAYVEEAFRVGASGYVLKSTAAAEILEAIHKVHDGQTFVSASVTRRSCTRDLSASD